MAQQKDPLEERDILKILDALDDERIQKKIIKILEPKFIEFGTGIDRSGIFKKEEE